MKKILSILAVAAISLMNAQDFKSKRGENMLPEKGDWAIGFSTDGIFKYLGNAFNGNLNNNAPIVGFSETVNNDFNGRFVGKYFTSDKSAYRVVFNLQLESNGLKLDNFTPDPSTTITTVPATPAPNVLTTISDSDENSTFTTNLSIGLGKEWRRGKTRLQGFYGADVLLFVSSETNTRTIDKETIVKVTTPAQTTTTKNNVETKTKFGTGFGFGVEGFIGAEYFIFPKIAIGAQYTYAARFISRSGKNETKTTTSSFENSLPLPSPAPFSSEQVTELNSDPRSNSNFGLTGVNVVSINLTLHF